MYIFIDECFSSCRKIHAHTKIFTWNNNNKFLVTHYDLFMNEEEKWCWNSLLAFLIIFPLMENTLKHLWKWNKIMYEIIELPLSSPPPIIMWISMNFFDLFTLHNAFFTVFHRMRVCICFFGAKQCVAQYKLSAGIICYGLYIRVVYIFITKALHNTHRVLCLWRAMSNFCLLISDDDDDDENLLWKARKLIWLKF